MQRKGGIAMKKLFALILFISLFLSCAADEEALTVNGLAVSPAEARLYLMNAESSYAEVVAYYRNLLGIDYWSLTTANGVTAAEAVKSDVFRELVTMNIYYIMAQAQNLVLSAEEKEACREDARTYYASLTITESDHISYDDVLQLLEKQSLADQMYSLLLNQVEIDEAAVVSTIDREACQLLSVNYLLSPETDDAAAQTLDSLRLLDDWQALDLPTMFSGSSELRAADREQYPDLYEAASHLAVGETSPVIKTDYGLFILRLIDDCDESAYLAAVEDALYEARAAAFADDANALYAQAEYTINVAFWDSMALGSAAAQ